MSHIAERDLADDTVWTERVSWIDRVPRSVSMLFVFLVFVGLWELVTRLGLVSPIILPTPARPSGTSSSSARTFSPAATCGRRSSSPSAR